MKRFGHVLRTHSNLIIKNFKKSDLNQDGKLNIDGFKKALLVPEVNLTMKEADIKEVFFLIEDKD